MWRLAWISFVTLGLCRNDGVFFLTCELARLKFKKRHIQTNVGDADVARGDRCNTAFRTIAFRRKIYDFSVASVGGQAR